MCSCANEIHTHELRTVVCNNTTHNEMHTHELQTFVGVCDAQLRTNEQQVQSPQQNVFVEHLFVSNTLLQIGQRKLLRTLVKIHHYVY